MNHAVLSTLHPSRQLCGYLGRDLRVCLGVSQRSGLNEDLSLHVGDIYMMQHGVLPHILTDNIEYEAYLIFMTETGRIISGVLGTDCWGETVLLTTETLSPATEYELIKTGHDLGKIDDIAHIAGLASVQVDAERGTPALSVPHL